MKVNNVFQYCVHNINREKEISIELQLALKSLIRRRVITCYIILLLLPLYYYHHYVKCTMYIYVHSVFAQTLKISWIFRSGDGEDGNERAVA